MPIYNTTGTTRPELRLRAADCVLIKNASCQLTCDVCGTQAVTTMVAALTFTDESPTGKDNGLKTKTFTRYGDSTRKHQHPVKVLWFFWVL